MNIKLVSKPGLRIYMNTRQLRAQRGASTFIISTPHGVLTTKGAIKQNSGGEVIAEIL
jgi:ribosomal protein S8